jgi:hypothetical protein
MLSLLRKLLGSKSAETTEVPYKVEAPVGEPALPFPAAKPTRKPTAKKTTTAKSKAPRKPRATKA